MEPVIVTGVSSGIGKAVASSLLDKGLFVFGSVLSREEAESLEKEWPERFSALVFDLRDPSALQEAFEKVEERLNGRPLKALVNNAGIARFGPLEFLDPAEIGEVLEVNVQGTLRVTQTFLPLLKKRDAYPAGRIINISSVSGLFTSPFLVPYCLSKYALESLSDGLRRELIPYGIQVISIRPGPVKTPIWQRAKTRVRSWPGTVYEPFFRELPKRIDKLEQRALRPEQVVGLVHKAILKKRPRARYTRTANPWALYGHLWLPGSWVEWIYSGALKRIMG